MAPLTSHAAIDPLGQVYAQGHIYRKAVERPGSRVVLIGMWLIFLPIAIVAGLPRSGVASWLIPLFSVVVLCLVTRNYLRQRRRMAEHGHLPHA